ncbi:potassium channel family protein [Alkalicoccus luteus]|uniref:TrkA family potassium uptake protein n=1 Tax=Alkalicoccus luteus TaxID=1237094 RepID=A0A969TVU0_9BACI|nr:TrkA family potassium uptake protein [Alkalicoccus luteus]NJP38467.1 TrkA family potassium uptake protein [Alkalicoccus luteus]
MRKKKTRHKNQYAVIGLGRFGGSVCRELHNMGHEVMAIDIDQDKVDQYSRFSTHAVQLDSTDERQLHGIGIRNFEHVVVAIGDNIQASILTTLVLKDEGVSQVWVKAQNMYHQKVLDKIGADVVVHPEFDMGKRIAHNIVSDKVIDYIDLSDDYSIIELRASDKIDGETLMSLQLRAKYGITLLAIKDGEAMNISPKPDEPIRTGNILLVIGHNNDLERFEDTEL